MSTREMKEMRNGKREVGVRLLTLSDCDYCMWLKSELDAAGIFYTNIDGYEHSEFADAIEDEFKTETYPIVFIDLGDNEVTIVPETSLETNKTLRTFNTIPELVGIIKSYIK
jgi:glutaredoxin